MLNEEHLAILKKGAVAWNRWREECSHTEPNLSTAKLCGANLCGFNFAGTKFNYADLSSSKLCTSNLSVADLIYTDLNHADLTGADLRRANLTNANLWGANLEDADLTTADLHCTTLTSANLLHTKLGYSSLFKAIFADNDLSQTFGLETAWHHGPSSVGLDTFWKSNGKIPEVFLRGAGVPNIFLEYAASLAGTPFEFYSCFISYSTKDEEFASRLHNDFQAKGIRCWKWDHDARTGRSLWGEIDQAIRIFDKLVLIASESSLKSPAVNREIERALVQEDERLKRKLAGNPKVDCDVLFPIRLDDYLLKGWEHERKVDVTKKVVADARGWEKDTAVYSRVRDRLVRDLKNEKPKPDKSKPAKAGH